jgi:hypothetical protein
MPILRLDGLSRLNQAPSQEIGNIIRHIRSNKDQEIGEIDAINVFINIIPEVALHNRLLEASP